MWDETGHRIGKPLAHGNSVQAVAIGRVGGRDVIVSASDTVRLWDDAGHPVDDPTFRPEPASAVAIHPAGIAAATGNAADDLDQDDRSDIRRQS